VTERFLPDPRPEFTRDLAALTASEQGEVLALVATILDNPHSADSILISITVELFWLRSTDDNRLWVQFRPQGGHRVSLLKCGRWPAIGPVM